MPNNGETLIEQLEAQVEELCEQEQYDEAIQFAQRICQLAAQQYGYDHPNYATTVSDLAGLCQIVGAYDKAEQFYLQALRIDEFALGKDSVDYASDLQDLARLYREIGQQDKAVQLYKQSLQIELKALGPEHPGYLRSLEVLKDWLKQSTPPIPRTIVKQAAFSPTAGVEEQIILLNDEVVTLYERGLFKQALEFALQARDLAEQYLDEEHRDYSASLNNLALLYDSMGDYEQALPLFLQAREICRITLGEHHPDYATHLNNLAGLYQIIGDYAQALPLYLQAQEICRITLGEHHPDYATHLNNLASLYCKIGDYAQSEPLLQQAQKIYRLTLGEHHPRYADSLTILSGLYCEMGDDAQALLLYLQAQEIYRITLGEQPPNNLALLYATIGDYEQTELLLLQAQEICRITLGEHHPDYAIPLGNLASLYCKIGDYAQAEPLLQQAQKIYRLTLGEHHPRYADGLTDLAGLYCEMGDYEQAAPLLQKAHQIQRNASGEEHPAYARSLINLAMLYAASAREEGALNLLQEATIIDSLMIGEFFSISSERQRSAYLQKIRGTHDRFLSLLCQLREVGATPRLGLELILRRKAIGAEAQATQRDAALSGKYPAVAPRLRALTTLRRQIAQKMLAGPGPEGLPAHQQRLNEWNARKDKLEAELARQIPEMNLEEKLRAADRQAVALVLPAGAVLVEFVRFNVCDFKAVPARGESQWKPARYLAFTLPAGEPDNIKMIDLGEAEPIDEMIDAFRRAMTGEEEQNEEAESGWEDDDEEAERIGNELRASVFDPVVLTLHGRQRLLIAPDGELARLPFEILPTGDGRQLIDEYKISYLSAGRDVLRFGAVVSGQPTAPVVIASPDFDLGTALPQETGQSPVERGRHSRDMRWSKNPFAPLPSAQVEGERIAALLRVEPLLAERAVEKRVKECRSPRILHLATHGFFLENQARDLNQDSRILGTLDMDRFAGAAMESPLLRSGLALAGANWKNKKFTPPPEAEDGILTAEDVTGLDLLATDLVVLSACETGLGEIQVGEGVLGLRRAFVLAGAKTLVMSLWHVADIATAILMTQFYDNLLQRRLARVEALREAQFYLRDVTVGELRAEWLNDEMIERFAAGDEEYKQELEDLAAYPDTHRLFESPYYWGAFICQGDPGPLDFA